MVLGAVKRGLGRWLRADLLQTIYDQNRKIAELAGAAQQLELENRALRAFAARQAKLEESEQRAQVLLEESRRERARLQDLVRGADFHVCLVGLHKEMLDLAGELQSAASNADLGRCRAASDGIVGKLSRLHLNKRSINQAALREMSAAD